MTDESQRPSGETRPKLSTSPAEPKPGPRLPWWPAPDTRPLGRHEVTLHTNWLQAGFLLGLGFWLAGVFIAVLTTVVLLAGGAAILGGVVSSLKGTTSSPATPGVIDVNSLPTCPPNYRFNPNKPNDICRVP